MTRSRKLLVGNRLMSDVAHGMEEITRSANLIGSAVGDGVVWTQLDHDATVARLYAVVANGVAGFLLLHSGVDL